MVDNFFRIKSFQVKLFQDLLALTFLNPEGLPVMSFKTAKHSARPRIDSDHCLVSQVILVDEAIGLDQGAEGQAEVEC